MEPVILTIQSGDSAILTFNDANQPALCRTAWDIAPFMPQLRRDWTAPDGCEWEQVGLLSAQIVRKSS